MAPESISSSMRLCRYWNKIPNVFFGCGCWLAWDETQIAWPSAWLFQVIFHAQHTSNAGLPDWYYQRKVVIGLNQIVGIVRNPCLKDFFLLVRVYQDRKSCWSTGDRSDPSLPGVDVRETVFLPNECFRRQTGVLHVWIHPLEWLPGELIQEVVWWCTSLLSCCGRFQGVTLLAQSLPLPGLLFHRPLGFWEDIRESPIAQRELIGPEWGHQGGCVVIRKSNLGSNSAWTSSESNELCPLALMATTCSSHCPLLSIL